MLRRLLVSGVAGVCLLGGCNVPLSGLLPPAGPVIQGSVAEMQGEEVRVGLLGSARAGGRQQEIVSVSARNGSFSLTLPAWPPVELMEQPDEIRSVVFTLRAYSDRNGNERFDDGEPLCECAAGKFRYFSSDGPSGSYLQGWNRLTDDGRYSQSFSTAFVL
ncbi:MAG: hypothetical protein VKN33_09710 [Candidatus Sericytochromatia bacterium]|nr:hypothetical protein [Candidatus Sericytochromatia bacterium]